jgi:cytochrome c peroxidase
VVFILVVYWLFAGGAGQLYGESWADEDSVPVGDPRIGYEARSYETQSRRITTQHGESANLLNLIRQPPVGLPKLSLDRLPTEASIALGRKLFFDRRLSFNATLSCAMCHIPEQGFGQYELITPVGIEGREVKRNSPALYNVAYRKHLFFDGREETLEQQIWGPLLAHNEMGNPAVGTVLSRLRGIEEYQRLFHQVFDEEITMQTLGMALADYQRGLLSGNSPFDQWVYGGNTHAVDDAVKRGFSVFILGECAACHQIDQTFSHFSDGNFHDTGIGYKASIARSGPVRVQLAPGVFVNTPSLQRSGFNDLGRYEATGKSADRWKYQTPSLRNIGVTQPYMHDGSLASLEEVIDFYDAGGVPHEGQDKRIRVLHLTPQQKADLLAFLYALTGDNIASLALDARLAPIGERR